MIVLTPACGGTLDLLVGVVEDVGESVLEMGDAGHLDGLGFPFGGFPLSGRGSRSGLGWAPGRPGRSASVAEDPTR